MEHCLLAIILLLLLPSVLSMRRKGSLTDSDLAHIEDMLNDIESDGDLRTIHIPPPPHSQMTHRDERILCRIGDKDYCPGEILFKLHRKELQLRQQSKKVFILFIPYFFTFLHQQCLGCY